MTNSLTAISPIDGRYNKHLADLAVCSGEYALIRYRVIVEVRWFIHLCQHLPILSTVSQQDIHWLASIITDFDQSDAEAIQVAERTTNHDVKAIEYWLKQRFSGHETLKQYQEIIHFACTSEDINNIAYALMVQQLRPILLNHMNAITDKLTSLAQAQASTPMLARTHGQAASPTTVGKEIANSIYRLRRQFSQLQAQELCAKINGAVGNFNAHIVACPDLDWINISRTFIESLELNWNPMTTQIEPHDYLAEFFHTLLRYNTILLDLSRDIWGYISIGYFSQKTVVGEIGSSTMPHKVNPIDFENAEGNLGLANALMEHMASKLLVSRWQRDLSDSTVLRNINSAIGYCLVSYLALARGLHKLQVNTARLSEDLEQNYEVLAEPIQTVMRYYAMPNPYERLKELTRGKSIDKESIQRFIRELKLPQQAEETLLALTPGKYTGLAEQLTQEYMTNADT